MAKGLGGGFPVAAIGGSREVMSMIAEGRYSHSGTYNANVIACAAVSATMDVLAEPGLYERQRALGETLMSGLRKLAADAGLPVVVEGLGTVFQLWFSEQPIRNWRDAERYADEALFTRWWQEMLLRGVLVPPEPVREPVPVARAHQGGRRPHPGRRRSRRFAVISRPTAKVMDRDGARSRGQPPGPLSAPDDPRPGRSGAGLLYEQVVDYVERLVVRARAGPRRHAAHLRRAGGERRRQPDHRPPRAR